MRPIATLLALLSLMWGGTAAHAEPRLETEGEVTTIQTPAPGRSVEWIMRVRAPDEDPGRVSLVLLEAEGRATEGGHPLSLRLELLDGQGDDAAGAFPLELASGTAAELRGRVVAVPSSGDSRSNAVRAIAALPAAAGDEYRGSDATLHFRFAAVQDGGSASFDGGLAMTGGEQTGWLAAVALAAAGLGGSLLIRRRGARWTRAGLFAAAAAVAVIAIAALVAVQVQAAYTDRVRLRSDLAADFEVAMLDDRGTIRRVATRPGETVRFTPAKGIVPGSAIRIQLALANNSAAVSAVPALRLEVPEGGIDHLERLLRLTVVESEHCGGAEDPAGERVLVGDPADPGAGVPLSELTESVVGTVLAPREGAAQSPGEAYTGGAGSCRTYLLTLQLADDPALRAMTGADWTVAVHLEGRSQA